MRLHDLESGVHVLQIAVHVLETTSLVPERPLTALQPSYELHSVRFNTHETKSKTAPIPIEEVGGKSIEGPKYGRK